jgi:hypothetical protein
MIVVADGVGGWELQGINPAEYARFICKAYIVCLYMAKADNYVQENAKLYLR